MIGFIKAFNEMVSDPKAHRIMMRRKYGSE